MYPSLRLVQPRKNRPFVTERLLNRCKESNQNKKIIHKALVACPSCPASAEPLFWPSVLSAASLFSRFGLFNNNYMYKRYQLKTSMVDISH